MNPVIAHITLRAMLGRRRVVLLLLLPATLLVLAAALVLDGESGTDAAAMLLHRYGIGTLLPIIGLIIGTGVLGPEIDEGTIAYLLSKPISRPVIIRTKLFIAVGLSLLFAALPVLLAGLILSGFAGGVSVGFAVGAAVGAVAYCAIFLLVSVLTRHAVVVGLLYALIWEGSIGGYVPGARTLSVQQWALGVSDALSPAPVLHASVGLAVAAVLLAVTTVAATVLAGQRLRSLAITGEE